jgi:hypothetical protein
MLYLLSVFKKACLHETPEASMTTGSALLARSAWTLSRVSRAGDHVLPKRLEQGNKAPARCSRRPYYKNSDVPTSFPQIISSLQTDGIENITSVVYQLQASIAKSFP